MKPKTRNWTATPGLMAALLLTMAMPATMGGQAPQQPGLPPLAVSQIEDGRRSEAMNQAFSLSFAEPISIREILLLLVRDTDLSVVLDPDVEGTFSGDLKNVTLQQALGLVLEPHGFTYTFHANVVRVRREQVQTRLFNINYVATRRSGTRGTGMTGMYGQGGYGYGTTGGVAAARLRRGLQRRHRRDWRQPGVGHRHGLGRRVRGTAGRGGDAALRGRAAEHRPQGGPASR